MVAVLRANVNMEINTRAIPDEAECHPVNSRTECEGKQAWFSNHVSQIGNMRLTSKQSGFVRASRSSVLKHYFETSQVEMPISTGENQIPHHPLPSSHLHPPILVILCLSPLLCSAL